MQSLLVYLDQCHLSRIVKTRSEATMAAFFSDGSYRLAISPLVVMETAGWDNTHLRRKLIEFIDGIPFVKLDISLKAIDHEVLGETRRILGQRPLPDLDMFGQWTGIDNQVPKSFSRAVSDIVLDPNIRRMDLEVKQRNAQHARETLARLRQDPGRSVEYRVRHEVKSALTHLFTALIKDRHLAVLTDAQYNQVVGEFILNNCPVFSTMIWTYALRSLNLSRQPVESDLNDVFLAAGAVQCRDFFVTESHLHDLFTALKTQSNYQGYKAKVFRSLQDFLSACSPQRMGVR